MRQMLLLAAVTVFVSCSSTQKTMDSWLGKSKPQLIRSWGTPDIIISDGGDGEVLIYPSHIYMPLYYPGGKFNYYDYKMFYVRPDGTLYHWTTKTENIPPHQIEFHAYQRY